MPLALVTGATGFVGPHLAAALRARGWGVRGLALPAEDVSRLEREHGLELHRADVRRSETLDAPMKGVDTVFHTAAIHGLWRERREYDEVNVGGTENVCRAALRAGVRRVVHVSTWTVCGIDSGRPLVEDAPLRPVPDAYTITKARADELVQRLVAEERLPAVIVRPAVMFGPGDRVNFARMADRLRAGKAVVVGSGRNLLPFAYVGDCVTGMILAAERDVPAGRVYNLAAEQPLTQEEFWRATAEEIGAAPPRLHVPIAALLAVAFLAERAVSGRPGRQPLVTRLGVKLFGRENRIVVDRARAELGYASQTPVREGIRLAARWYLRELEAGGGASGGR